MSNLVPVYGRVYLIRCLISGKLYVGQTVELAEERFLGHFQDARRKKSNRPFCNALNKYGRESFQINVLCSCSSQEELDLMEDLYIVIFDTMHRDKGYNRKRGGSRGKHSEETKKLFSEQRRGEGNHKYRSDLDTETLVRLYNEGLSTIKLEALFSANRATIWSRLKEAGVVMRPESSGSPSVEAREKLSKLFSGSGSPSYRHDLSSEEAIRLYLGGLSTSDIGQMFSVDANTIKNRLDKSGIKLRPAKGLGGFRPRRNDVPTEELIKLHAVGESTTSLAQTFSISPSAVRRRLSRAKGSKNAKRISEEGRASVKAHQVRNPLE